MEMEKHFELFKRGAQAHTEAVRVQLADAYGQPVAVHVFVASVAQQGNDMEKPYAVIGLCEQWNQKKKDRGNESEPGSSNATRSSNMTTLRRKARLATLSSITHRVGTGAITQVPLS